MNLTGEELQRAIRGYVEDMVLAGFDLPDQNPFILDIPTTKPRKSARMWRTFTVLRLLGMS